MNVVKLIFSLNLLDIFPEEIKFSFERVTWNFSNYEKS